MVKRVSWIIVHDGLNYEELRKTNGHYVLVNYKHSYHANYITAEMRAFKDMFHKKQLRSRSTRATRYIFEVETEKGIFRTEETENKNI